MNIPFSKVHGAKNDFLLTLVADAPADPRIAQAICDRHTGVGADGWMLVDSRAGDRFDASIRLFNSDGSEPELSGNGTRCAAAYLIERGLVTGEQFRIRTGAGVKNLRLIARDELEFSFEMNMGVPVVETEPEALTLSEGICNVAVVDVGNPQCVVFVDDFDFDWRSMGAEIERHARFPRRTNVSFVRQAGPHAIEVRFFERGAGETMSSGTGSAGAAAAAIRLGIAESPVEVVTPAGPLHLRWDESIYLEGPAEIVADGVYHMREWR